MYTNNVIRTLHKDRILSKSFYENSTYNESPSLPYLSLREKYKRSLSPLSFSLLFYKHLGNE